MVELCVGRVFSGEVSAETVMFLGMQSALDPLWPRLTSLKLSNRPTWDSVASTLSFLSPNIKVLSLILPRDPSILLQPILSTASGRCHAVQELALDVVTDDIHSAHWVGGVISACRDNLRTLEIHSPFRVEYLHIIANLPQLRMLRLERAQFPIDIPLGAFPALEEFTFLRFQGRRLQHFLQRLCTTNLKVAKIYSTDAIDIKKSIKALSKFSTSLRFLEISAATGLDLLRASVLRNLFTNLKYLHLRCFRYGDVSHNACTFRPSDPAVAELGSAMPNLTYLTLGSPTCTNLQCVSFRSLVSLSRNCRDLDTLEIKVDFQTMVSFPFLPPKREDAETNSSCDGTEASGDGCCRLRKLILGLSVLPDRIDSGWLVAVGLGKIFPGLSEVEGYGSERSRWDQVGKNIRNSRHVLRAVGQ